MIVEPRADHVVWLDGAFVPWREATMHVTDHHYGVGVFEGVRAYAVEGGAAVFRLQDHTARLFRSAHIIRIPIPEKYGRDLLNDVQLEVLRLNGLTNAYIRPFVFFGGMLGISPGTQDLSVHVAVMALEWNRPSAYGGAGSISTGISLKSASFVRNHAGSILSKAKANANYMGGILAREEARACGADDAIILDHDGFVTETSGANVFAVSRGRIYTPPLESVLEGITRETVIALAAERGWPVVERRLARDELYVADEVFLTGTAVEVTPVREIDGRSIGSGARGPVTEKLQRLYAAHVRGDGEHRSEWLSRA